MKDLINSLSMYPYAPQTPLLQKVFCTAKLTNTLATTVHPPEVLGLIGVVGIFPARRRKS
jgi:hypothetical protein